MDIYGFYIHRQPINKETKMGNKIILHIVAAYTTSDYELTTYNSSLQIT